MAQRDVDADEVLTREMGVRLRQAREDRGLSLRSLAHAIEVSPSLLSQIENGLARPSVGTLWAIVDELDVSLDRLFSRSPTPDGGATPGLAVQRDGEREVIALSGGVTWEQLDAAHDPGVVFAFVTYEPGLVEGVDGDARPAARHRGREYGYLISGRLLIRTAESQVEVGPGDAVSLDSSRPHSFVAVGEEPARAVWFNDTR